MKKKRINITLDLDVIKMADNQVKRDYKSSRSAHIQDLIIKEERRIDDGK